MKIEAKQRLLADEGTGEAPAKAIAMQLAAAWKKMMPHSTCFPSAGALNPSDVKMHAWYIKFKSVQSKDEVSNGIWENDPFSMMISIDPTRDGGFECECSCSVHTLPTAAESHYAFSSERLRKFTAKGDAAKVTKNCIAYMQKGKELLKKMVDEGRMTPNDRQGIKEQFDWRTKVGASAEAKERLLAVPSLREQFKKEGDLSDSDPEIQEENTLVDPNENSGV